MGCGAGGDLLTGLYSTPSVPRRASVFPSALRCPELDGAGGSPGEATEDGNPDKVRRGLKTRNVVETFLNVRPRLPSVSGPANRRTFLVHVLQPDDHGLYEWASSKIKILQCDDVQFGPTWISCVFAGVGGGIRKSVFPMDLVVEVVEEIPPAEVRAARRRIKKREQEAEQRPLNRRVHDPAYR